MSENEDGIERILVGCRTILRNGGNREKKELKKVVRAMDWFKNFGYDYCKSIERLEDELGIEEDDILKWE